MLYICTKHISHATTLFWLEPQPQRLPQATTTTMATTKQDVETTTKKCGFSGPNNSDEDCDDLVAGQYPEEYYSEEWGTKDQGWKD